ncbi:ABC transporter ATP-binding protein [uncultured Tessaracoccus sp.]|uniref:ABC transporter ATP-binding protein n=1 Tax=uncultured Tessaracoccus sp. TaxID=905023 RepID=UPI002621E8D1|nr:ABC transporter ATP-binding protein [uncultured Tessaracoccus sp.]
MRSHETTRGKERSSLVMLWRYVRPHWMSFALVLVLTPIGVLVSVAIPLLLGRAVDGPIAHRDINGILLSGLLILLAGTFDAGVNWLRRWIMSDVTSHIEASMRFDLFDKLQALQMGFHKRWESGQLLSRIMSDLGLLRRFMSFGLLMLILDSLRIIVVLAIMVTMYWQLGMIVLVLIVPVVLVTWGLVTRSARISREVQDATGDIASLAEESLHGVRVIRSFGRVKYAFDKFDGGAVKLRELGVRRQNLASVLWTLLEVFPNVLLVLVSGGAAYAAAAGLLTLGQVVAFVTLLLSIAWPIGGLGFLLSFAGEAAAAADRVKEVFDEPITIHSGTRTIADPRGKLEFRNVDFQFDDASFSTLHDLDLVIEPGETIALVGGTGSGKSTIVALIPRLLDVTGGSIELDGVDVRDLELTQLRSLIGTAFEEPILFSMSARENLTLGRPEATDEEIEEAVRVAKAEFVYDLPWGLDTRLGEQGLSLSGGQRQRLALARAILVKPKVLVLDDTLSALDIHTEAEVEEALKRTLVGVTGIVVAHRASTVLLADRVAMLVDGRIAHVGQHSELLANVPEYRELLSADYQIEPGLGVHA